MGKTKAPENALRTARLKKGLTQEALARQADVSLGTIRNLETGRQRPGLDVASAVAAVFRMDPRKLFPDSVAS